MKEEEEKKSNAQKTLFHTSVVVYFSIGDVFRRWWSKKVFCANGPTDSMTWLRSNLYFFTLCYSPIRQPNFIRFNFWNYKRRSTFYHLPYLDSVGRFQCELCGAVDPISQCEMCLCGWLICASAVRLANENVIWRWRHSVRLLMEASQAKPFRKLFCSMNFIRISPASNDKLYRI